MFPYQVDPSKKQVLPSVIQAWKELGPRGIIRGRWPRTESMFYPTREKMDFYDKMMRAPANDGETRRAKEQLKIAVEGAKGVWQCTHCAKYFTSYDSAHRHKQAGTRCFDTRIDLINYEGKFVCIVCLEKRQTRACLLHHLVYTSCGDEERLMELGYQGLKLV